MKLDNAVFLSCHPLCGMPLWSFNIIVVWRIVPSSAQRCLSLRDLNIYSSLITLVFKQKSNKAVLFFSLLHLDSDAITDSMLRS